LAGRKGVGSGTSNMAMSEAVDLVRKSGLPFFRGRVIDVFLELQSFGAGALVEEKDGTEFRWMSSPVLLARVATGERTAK
jgi:hypothetical protein